MENYKIFSMVLLDFLLSCSENNSLKIRLVDVGVKLGDHIILEYVQVYYPPSKVFTCSPYFFSIKLLISSLNRDFSFFIF